MEGIQATALGLARHALTGGPRNRPDRDGFPCGSSPREPVHPRVAVDLARGKLVVEPAEASHVLDRRWAALPARHDVVELAPWLLDEPLPLRVALEEEI